MDAFGADALIYAAVPGHPLGRGELVGSDFFPTLRRLIGEMHRRGLAYVDLHKRENILVGDDGRPYLIDFQISFDVTHPRVRWIRGIGRVFACLSRADHYHLDKHARHHAPGVRPARRPDPPLWIRFHRAVGVPFRRLRRRLLVLAGVRGPGGSAATEVFAEDAVRRDEAARAA